MRRRLAVLIAALVLVSLAACGHDRDDKPTPQAQPAVPGASAAPLPGGSASADVAPGASGGAPATGKPAGAQPSTGPGGSTAGPGGSTVKPGGSTVKPGGSTARPGGGKGATNRAEMSAAGVGPYAIGVAHAKLSSSGLVGKVSTDQNGCVRGTGVREYYAPGLVFTQGKLQHVKITSTKVKTAEGVRVGSAFATVKGAYPAGKVLDDWVGASAWYATSGDNALLFRIKNDKVSAIEAGGAATLSFTFTDNQGC